MNMNKYKIIYANGKEVIVNANSSLEVVKKYELATKENTNTKLIQMTDSNIDTLNSFFSKF